MIPATSTIGIILAGGRSSRMGGGDKCLLPLNARPLLARVIERTSPQVAHLVISANGDATRFASFGLPVVADTIAGQIGPLAGILAGLDHAAGSKDCLCMLCVAADTPFLPLDLAGRLAEAAHGRIAVAASNGRVHPVFSLWPVSMRARLRRHLETGGDRSVQAFAEAKNCVVVDFPDIVVGSRVVDPFFNVNRPDDLAQAEVIAKEVDA